MTAMNIKMKNIRLSLEDLTGREYMDALCEARAFLEGGTKAGYLALAQEKVDFFPEDFQERLDSLLPFVGRQVVSAFANSSDGAATAAFNKASHKTMAPLDGMGFYRIAEDGRLYVITKSEHYHASLGHHFPGYRLVQLAQRLGIDNITHNNTRGHITRLVERELVRVANGLAKADEAGLARVVASKEPHVLNRVLNIETGSLAVEAALKMALARFYRQDDTSPQPANAGRTPVFLVLADREGGPKANYHGTTVMTQLLRGLWPELKAGMAEHGLYQVQQVMLNDIADLQAALDKWDVAPYRVAAFFHEIVLMNYGAIRLTPEYLHAAYDLCHAHEVPIIDDEIQSCIWSPQLFMFREYGLNPDMVSVGKGFPGGQYPASRVLVTSQYDTLSQFGALVTNGQEELASLAYLITMAFAEANCEYVATLGDYYEARLNDLATEFPAVVEKVEGSRHMGSLFFYSSEQAKAFVKTMNGAGYDVSAQTYKLDAPPVVLTKLPLIASPMMVEQFIGEMGQALANLNGK
jgi:acetylornithine/succinyldiaminopimelate/putrescine aminotransferase